VRVKARVPIAAVRKRFIILKPEKTLERRKRKRQNAAIKGSLLWVTARKEK
jgi:hypothetical protein